MGGEGSKVARGHERAAARGRDASIPRRVRRTAARLGAAHGRLGALREEPRPDAAARGRRRTSCALLRELAARGSRCPRRRRTRAPGSDPARTIALRPERVRALLGAAIADARDRRHPRRASASASSAARSRARACACPRARATKDITIEQDLIEEVGRIYRYGNIPERRWWRRSRRRRATSGARSCARSQDRLAGAARFHETISYSFLADELLATLGARRRCRTSQVVNPVGRGALARAPLGAAEPARRCSSRTAASATRCACSRSARATCPSTRTSAASRARCTSSRLVLARSARRPRARASTRGALPRAARRDRRDLLDEPGARAPLWRAAPAEGDARRWAHPAPRGAARPRRARRRRGCSPRSSRACARALGLAGELASDVAVARVSIDALLRARPPRAARALPAAAALPRRQGRRGARRCPRPSAPRRERRRRSRRPARGSSAASSSSTSTAARSSAPGAQVARLARAAAGRRRAR